jgi:hypothetical protein
MQNGLYQLKSDHKRIAFYLDTKKGESCRARFQWPTTRQWRDLAGKSSSTSLSRHTQRFTQQDPEWQLALEHSVVCAQSFLVVDLTNKHYFTICLRHIP